MITLESQFCGLSFHILDKPVSGSEAFLDLIRSKRQEVPT